MDVPYESLRYIVSENKTLHQILNEYGVAIVPDMLNDSECENMNNGMWKTLEDLTSNLTVQIKRDQPNTWSEIKKLYPLKSMLIQNWSIGHAQYIWDIRQNQKIVNFFANFWNCTNNDLIVSFDVIQSKAGYLTKESFHCDQDYKNSSFQCLQSWITANDVNEGDATLTILEGSHLYHEDFYNKFNKKNYILNDDELNFYYSLNCPIKKIKCPAGSLVCWDSRLIHCGSPPLRTRFSPNIRNVVYLCYLPKHLCCDKNLSKRRKAFHEMRMTTHFPHKAILFNKFPHTYKPILNDLGKSLIPITDPITDDTNYRLFVV